MAKTQGNGSQPPEDTEQELETSHKSQESWRGLGQMSFNSGRWSRLLPGAGILCGACLTRTVLERPVTWGTEAEWKTVARWTCYLKLCFDAEKLVNDSLAQQGQSS